MSDLHFDETFDFVSDGSGGGGLCSALFMRSTGKSVAAIEPQPRLGGATSRSGGAVTDENARGLRGDGSVIAGLCATGIGTASVMGRCYPGAGPSVGPSYAFGYIAAKHAAHAGNMA